MSVGICSDRELNYGHMLNIYSPTLTHHRLTCQGPVLSVQEEKMSVGIHSDRGVNYGHKLNIYSPTLNTSETDMPRTCAICIGGNNVCRHLFR